MGENTNTMDIGKDGTLPGDVNQYVGMDEFAFALGYHKTDYTPINASAALGAANMAHEIMQSNLLANGLYNGNITWMATQLNNLSSLRADGTPDEYGIRIGAYKYDQLNRLTKSKSYGYINNSGLATTILTLSHNSTSGHNRWRADYTYDANGNIRTAYVTTGSGLMDNLSYRYGSVLPGQRLTTNNRLSQVTEAVPAANFAGDIDPGQGGNNYTYDAIGNLIGDVQETTTIEWNVYGKVKKVTRTNNGTYITFTYDASGQRVKKALYQTSGNVLQSETYYVRDAAGNVLNTYVKQGANTAAEYSIYGSGRVGMRKESYTSDPTATAGTMSENRPDNTVYELSNHLGNVNAVVSGLKIGVGTTNATSYKVRVMSLMDYYPFGMTMLDRQYNDNSYRYGFGGQEEDREMGADLYTAEYWQYDARLGRRWNVDPMTGKYPEISPYAVFLNNPIYYNDPDGNDPPKYGKLLPNEGLTQFLKRNGYTGKTKDDWLTLLENLRTSNPYTFKGKYYSVWSDEMKWQYFNNQKLQNNQLLFLPFQITAFDKFEEFSTFTGSSKSGLTVNKPSSSSGFNIDNAITTLNRNALPGSDGACARYVRYALQAGGLNTSKNPVPAYEYKTYLMNKGFRQINITGYSPLRGDIAVMESFIGIKKPHPYGHIQMYNGSQWVSDFRQPNFWPGSDYRNYKPPYVILRWGN